MAKLLWLTDTHLNFCSYFKLLAFIKHIENTEFDRLLITGDISDGVSLKHHLKMLAQKISRPISFVLGNHDYYGRCIADVHNEIIDLLEDYPQLSWLSTSDPFVLDSDSCLVGHDGWYDAFAGSNLVMNYVWDFSFIRDFRLLFSMDDKLEEIRRMTRISAENIKQKILKNIDKFDRFYIGTHVPPFQSCFDEIQSLMLAYNSNTLLGDALTSLADLHPNKTFIVLSGHTHIEYTSAPRQNLLNKVSKASYVGCHVQENTIDTSFFMRSI